MEIQERDRIIPGKTNFMKRNGFASEREYKERMAEEGRFMYHFHLCCPSLEELKIQMEELGRKLAEKNLHLDRFGVSLDYAMALPEGEREKYRSGQGLYMVKQTDWNMLGHSAHMQPHLGDNMIGSPASYENVRAALKAGVTTIGNISQFFGWDYPEYQDVEMRTKSTAAAIRLMADCREYGTLIHSNLDDGYGNAAGDLGLLAGCALLEKYLIEELLHAKLAHSFGDMFHSPFKRLVFLSALKKIHKGSMTGSMIFTNKLGRNHQDKGLNTAHLSECLLCDMAGQFLYRTGHAITAMADGGLTADVTAEEIVRTLEYARELEAYVPEYAKMIDRDRIDETADKVVERGELFLEYVLKALGERIDIRNPYEMMLEIKKMGMGRLMEELAPKDGTDVIITDYMIYKAAERS